MINKDAPFPQANDFLKVLKIVNIEKEENLKNNEYLSVYLEDITQRQVSYYLSATDYLGITFKREFTDTGKNLRNLSNKKQLVELMRILISDDIIGTVYFTEKIYSMKLNIDDVIDIMKAKTELSSDEMYKRRGQTIVSWVRWMNVILNEAPSVKRDEPALEEIARLLESANCDEIEINHLLARFLEEEAPSYVQIMNASKTDIVK